MPRPIAYVILSDLHFGAHTSLMTALDGDRPAPDRTAPMARALAAALRELVGGQDPLPRLVLAGDTLELALVQTNSALMAFEGFIAEVAGGDDPCVRPDVWFIPGNHDHHVWEMAREEMYSAHVSTVPPGTRLAKPFHVSVMTQTDDGAVGELPARGQPVSVRILDALAPRVGAQVTFRAFYPNLALRTPDDRWALVHHGHFTEPIYTLMTSLRRALFPPTPDEEEAAAGRFWMLEEENFAWIDFVWSALGRSSAAGGAVGTVYELLQDEAATSALVSNVVDQGFDRLASTGRRRAWERALLVAARPVARAAVHSMARRIRNRERGNLQGPLGPHSESGLRRYLSGELWAQFDDETTLLGIGPPAAVSFVFGHTHKPFESVWTVPPWGRMPVLNTGGWVVDRPEASPVIGSSMVLLDDELNPAAVRLTTQSSSPSHHVVRVVAPDQEGPNPLYRDLLERVDPLTGVWKEVAATAVTEIAVRREMVRRRITAHTRDLRSRG